MALLDMLLGAPLKESEEAKERVGPLRGIPIFGLDALSSAAYGPEAALTILIPLGAAGLAYIFPLTLAIAILLIIVFFSYRQTIAAYPSGGGSYTVAKENLGQRAGIVAAAALMIDYLLNVAVGISAGVGALVSAAPALQPYTLPLCLAILVLITLANLRGMSEPGSLFLAPVCLFVGTMLGVIGWGLARAIASGGHPVPIVPPRPLQMSAAPVSAWIVLKAFSSGCTALTGVEAVSNGVTAFQKPVVKNARITLGSIISILVVMLLGIAWLAHAYQIPATRPGGPEYQSLLSQLTAAVFGRGVLYYITSAGVLSVLCLSANTSFAGFPQVCRTVALDGYLPRSLANRGRRLVYFEGILILAVLAAALLILFGGVTDRLIPLFAVGAFLAFTMSQAGMVAHGRKQAQAKSSRLSVFVNGLGAVATGVTMVVIVAAKFTSGAWVVVLLLPSIVAAMMATNRHYARVERQTAPRAGTIGKTAKPPLAVVPLERWSSLTQKAIEFALTISPDVQVVHVDYPDADELPTNWAADLAREAQDAGFTAPRIVHVPSPYRFVLQPVIDHILNLEKRHRDREIAVVVPRLVEPHWYDYFLHNQRSELLSGLLLLGGGRRIVIVNVPWYLERPEKSWLRRFFTRRGSSEPEQRGPARKSGA